ncbi:MAG: tetratricopeptide repeat protein [Myxococcales bacterium]|nr:tetratricopeptide repeat protein [Myxococcales bacterium]
MASLTALLLWSLAALADPADALDPVARRMWDEAVRMEQDGRYASAAVRYRAVSRLDPEWTAAVVSLGRVQAADDQGLQAEQTWASLPYDADAVEALGRHQLERGATTDAIESFRRLVALRPEWPGTRVLLASALAEGDPDGASELLHAYLQLQGIRPEADGLRPIALEVGSSLRTLGDPEAARSLVEAVLARDPDAVDVLGDLLDEIEVDEVASQLQRTVDAPLTPDQVAVVRRARESLATGDVDGARRPLEVLVVEQPLSAVAWSSLAQIRLAASDPVGAEEALRAAIRLDPFDVDQLVALARLLSDWYGGRFDDEAAQIWARAVRRRPEDPELWAQRAVAERRAGRPESALRCWRQVLALDPDGPHAEQAEREVRGAELPRAVEPDLPSAPGRPPSVPEPAWVAFHRALAWRERGGPEAGERALAELAVVRASAPGFVPALDLEAAVRLDTGEVETAGRLLEQATALEPGRGDLAWRLAAVRELEGRTADAEDLRRRAAELGDPEGLWWRARRQAEGWRWWSARRTLATYFSRSAGGPDWDRAQALDADLEWRIRASVVGAAGAALGTLLLPVAWWRRRRGVALAVLLEREPRLAREVAAICAAIRHEVLKHHLGALVAVADALDDRDPEPARWAAERWFGPGGALAKLDGYVAELRGLGRRAGVELDLEQDPDLGPILRAASALRRLEPRLRKGHGRALADELRTLAGPLGSLGSRALGRLVDGLCLMRVDASLVERVAARTVAEFDGERVPRVEVRGTDEALWVRMFRRELEDVLTNLVRNAIEAAPTAPAVAVVLGVDEDWVTGLQRVEVAVVDQAPGELTTERLRSRELSRGLGLVVDLTGRAGGTVRVDPAPSLAGPGDWRKAVVVALPRVERADEEDEG